jgi:hypothetical protein
MIKSSTVRNPKKRPSASEDRRPVFDSVVQLAEELGVSRESGL